MVEPQGEQKSVDGVGGVCSQQLEMGPDASECQSVEDEEVIPPQGPLLAIRALLKLSTNQLEAAASLPDSSSRAWTPEAPAGLSKLFHCSRTSALAFSLTFLSLLLAEWTAPSFILNR